uniref:DDE Tnp4 domain-containing protein n=1 Tax=Oryzias latipes TaxID=8090 RepID=A0A3B3H2W4_ORYLA
MDANNSVANRGALLSLLNLYSQSTQNYNNLLILRRKLKRRRARVLAIAFSGAVLATVERNVWVRSRSQAWWDADVSGFTDAEFISNFIMTRSTFNYICECLRLTLSREETCLRRPITVQKRVGVYWLATGACYGTIVNLFKSTILASLLFDRTIYICKNIILENCTYENIHSSPTSLLDGQGVSIMRGYSGIPICTHSQREGGAFSEIMGVQVPIVLLGDPAYPLRSWLLKGYCDTGALTADQKNFNERHSRARMTVECAFGQLKGRWRCLAKRLDVDVSFVPTIVGACCTLHNRLAEGRGFVDVQPSRVREALTQLFFSQQNQQEISKSFCRNSSQSQELQGLMGDLGSYCDMKENPSNRKDFI